MEWAKIKYEILIYDDDSTITYEDLAVLINRVPEAKLFGSAENKGRAFARNYLAQKAQYPMLLFLDCDGKIPDKKFISNYLPYFSELNRVVSGGRIYQSSKPIYPELYLHWRYGTKVESITAFSRNQKPYQTFHSNNFIVSKAILTQIPFDTNLSQYGHEDSLWAQELKKRSIPIFHIDNPVEHLGLETADIFLTKAQMAVQNLILLRQKGKSTESRLESFYHESILARIKMIDMVFKILAFFKPLIIWQLKSAKPKLSLLSLLKAIQYSELIHSAKRKI